MPETNTDQKTAVLLKRLLQDDAAAWQELVTEYSSLLLTIARRTFASYGFEASLQDWEDVVAEVWKNLLAHNRRIIRQCRERGGLPQILVVLTRHRAIDLMRARKIKTSMFHDDTTTAEPEREAPNSIPRSMMVELLRELSPRERTLIQLFFLQNKKYREIAALTGIPQNSIGPTLGRALNKMRPLMQKLLER